MAYSWRGGLGGNLDFTDFLQKSFMVLYHQPLDHKNFTMLVNLDVVFVNFLILNIIFWQEMTTFNQDTIFTKAYAKYHPKCE